MNKLMYYVNKVADRGKVSGKTNFQILENCIQEMRRKQRVAFFGKNGYNDFTFPERLTIKSQ